MANADCGEIKGRWAQQAIEMMDIDYLLEFFNNQLAGCSREVQPSKWYALAGKLDLVHPGVNNRDMLMLMQRFIETTPPELRWACTRGIVLRRLESFSPSGMP